jgi:DNA-binding transcriptional LysR family regulator
VRVPSTFRSNNGYALRDAMLAGHGITVMPIVFIKDELSRGSATQFLEEYTPAPIPVNAVYPSGRFVSAKVRRFIDFLQQQLPRIPGLIAPEARVLSPDAALTKVN